MNHDCIEHTQKGNAKGYCMAYVKELGEEYGIHRCYVHDIVRGRRRTYE